MSDDRQEIIETLTRAREIFREHGGIKGYPYDSEGNVCALGALRLAILDDDYNYFINHYEDAHNVLSSVAFRLHGTWVVYSVNDNAKDPMPVILDLYDHAIKELENDE